MSVGRNGDGRWRGGVDRVIAWPDETQEHCTRNEQEASTEYHHSYDEGCLLVEI